MPTDFVITIEDTIAYGNAIALLDLCEGNPWCVDDSTHEGPIIQLHFAMWNIYFRFVAYNTGRENESDINRERKITIKNSRKVLLDSSMQYWWAIVSIIHWDGNKSYSQSTWGSDSQATWHQDRILIIMKYRVIQESCSEHQAVFFHESFPDSKVHGANMGSTWVLSAPDGPHVGPVNLAIRDGATGWQCHIFQTRKSC